MSNQAATQQMLEVVRHARARAQKAEGEYDAGEMRLQMKASRSIDLFGGTATSQVVDIASDARRLCDALYAAYQTLVRTVDEECRPLLAMDPDMDAVREVKDLIRWLNDESEISNNFTASVNYHDLGQVASAKYVPTMENKMIQSYWEDRYDRWPGRAEMEAAKRRVQEEARRAQQAEREARYQVEMEEYKERLAVWEKENAEVQSRRAREIETRMSAERSRLVAEDEGRYQYNLNAQQARMQNLLQMKARAEAELAGLGFFAFGRKNQLKRDIEQMGILISKCDAEAYEIRNRYAQDQATLESRLQQAKNGIVQEIEKAIPAPERPREPGKFNAAPMTAVQIANQGIIEEIYNTLAEHGGLMTVTDIMEQCPACADLSNTRVSALLRQMIGTRVERIEEKRKAYFRAIPDAAPARSSDEDRQAKIDRALYAPTAQEMANRSVQDAIVEFLRDEGRPCTITDIMEGCPAVQDLTNQRVSALIRQMVGTRVERTEINRKAYFEAI